MASRSTLANCAARARLGSAARSVAIVTGFCAVVDDRVTAETDGPPGALFLARALAALGVEVTLVSDRHALPLLAAGCAAWRLDSRMLLEFPFQSCDDWIDVFLASPLGGRLTHLVAIERPAPSHTLESLAAQPRAGAVPAERFAAEVPPPERDVCHNMRGQSIDRWTAPLHRLFEAVGRRQLDISTIGIGDGGNELGMGRYPWELLAEALGDGRSGAIVSRVAADWVPIAGVSDWGAYALALATARLRGATGLGRSWTADAQRTLVETIVDEAAAVDGVTLRSEATVDSLPLDTYLEPLVEMRRLLGFDD